MSEYNIQMNKYNALNTEYDQLYPATKIKNVDGLDTALQSKPNPNLLDNWYFANPIDQRGGYVVPPGTVIYKDTALTVVNTTATTYLKVSYVNETYGLYINANGNGFYVKRSDMVRGYTGAVYGIDRFYTNDTYGTTLITDEGLVLIAGQNHRSQAQFFDFVVQNDTEVTLSALYKGDILLDYWGTSRAPEHADDWSVATYTYTIPAGTNLANRLYCPTFKARANNTCTVKAVKLELGSQQTLAHQENGKWVLNEIPDYGEQLARCNMYQVLYGNLKSDEAFAPLGAGYSYNGNTIFVMLDLPQELCKSATKEVEIIGSLANFGLYYNQAEYVVPSAVSIDQVGTRYIGLKFTVTSTPASSYVLKPRTTGTGLLIKANL